MKTLSFYFRLALAFFPLSCGAAQAAPAASQPNVILFLADDLGWSDLGCYGSDFYQTPHIDRLAREGVRFTQACAAAPVCSPTRASLLTGKSPARLHLTDWLPGRPNRRNQKMARPQINQRLALEESTLAEEFRQLGYATGHIGKWHLGGAGFGPENQGFDVNIAGDDTGTPLSYFHPFQKGARTMPGLGESKPGEYLTDRLTEEAARFIGSRRDKPFFLFVSHYAPHTPLEAKRDVIEKYYKLDSSGKRHTNIYYAAMLESLDDSVGRILQKLTEQGLATNTIFVFTSDNGGLSTREGPNTPATSNLPLRAGKGHLHEGGLRVPWIVWAPGRIAGGRIESTPVISTDLFRTLLAAAGADKSSVTDGENLWPLLRGEGSVAARPLFWHYPHYSNQGGKPGGAVREGDFKLVESFENGFLELYNLSSDSSEQTNLAGQFPEKANGLQKKLADWRKSSGAQMMELHADYTPDPIRPSKDGVVLLHGKDAAIHGVNVRYEPPAHKNTIGYWTKLDDWVSWDFEIREPGAYSVEILQGCGKGSGGSEVEFSAGGQAISVIVEDTGHFQNFKERNIGQFRFEQAGKFTLAVKPKTKPGVAVMDLRQVVLRPAR